MNSEELEQSLRTEFESYLKNVLADMRQDVSEFQKQFEAEFEKHKAQIDEVFQSFSSRIAADRQLDSNFSDSVVEHLRLSRDEGARITAMAIAEAEELEKQNAPEPVEAPQPTISFSEIRDAINDISTKTTQSAILKTLVHHAAQFTPRGAFFIIKNEHFVGWRVFGKKGETVDEHTVREVFFPVASATILGESVRSLSAVESTYGTYDDDSIYLNKLEYGHPEKMYAVPLIVRGRSVAVLYADNDDTAEEINIEALETLVRVASLTVEILASSRGVQSPAEESAAPTAAYGSYEESVAPANFAAQETNDGQSAPQFAAEVESSDETPAEQSYQFSDYTSPQQETAAEQSAGPSNEEYSYAPATEQDFSYQPIEQPAESFETTEYQSSYEGDSFTFKPSDETDLTPIQEDEEAAVEAENAEEETPRFESEPRWNQPVETGDYYTKEPSSVSFEKPSYEPAGSSYEFAEPQTYETEVAVAEAETEYAPSVAATNDYQFETSSSYEAPQAEFDAAPQSFEAPAYEEPQYEAPKFEMPSSETPAYEAPQYETESVAPSNGVSYDSGASQNGSTETYAAVEAPAISESAVKQTGRSRFSERNVDLPIEVSEDERRLHNDARRFARLLVSEIKLYNEQKVKEGREGSDLYERLREAIDRSREMYDKRVQPPVAAKFDYFHYELVSSLAEGDAAKLGASYPGAAV